VERWASAHLQNYTGGGVAPALNLGAKHPYYWVVGGGVVRGIAPDSV